MIKILSQKKIIPVSAILSIGGVVLYAHETTQRHNLIIGGVVFM